MRCASSGSEFGGVIAVISYGKCNCASCRVCVWGNGGVAPPLDADEWSVAAIPQEIEPPVLLGRGWIRPRHGLIDTETRRISYRCVESNSGRRLSTELARLHLYLHEQSSVR
jgi:hypothetical protein